MTDTQASFDGSPTGNSQPLPDFDVNAVFEQAQATVGAIKNEIVRQQQIKLETETRIRDLREALAKTERIVSAMTPRSRAKKETDAKPAPAKKPASTSKKAAAANA
jgi:hypothetical protein